MNCYDSNRQIFIERALPMMEKKFGTKIKIKRTLFDILIYRIRKYQYDYHLEKMDFAVMKFDWFYNDCDCYMSYWQINRAAKEIIKSLR